MLSLSVFIVDFKSEVYQSGSQYFLRTNLSLASFYRFRPFLVGSSDSGNLVITPVLLPLLKYHFKKSKSETLRHKPVIPTLGEVDSRT
jgi:hypothetical protein